MDLDEVAEILIACEQLRTITCHWSYLNGINQSPSNLYEALLRHRSTLQTLSLDMREVRFDGSINIQKKLGTLQSFTVLETISLCETALLGNLRTLTEFPDRLFESPLSGLLPTTMKEFDLLLLTDSWGRRREACLDQSFSLWSFVADCKRYYTQLGKINVKSSQPLRARDVLAAFKKSNIHFRLLKEGDDGTWK
jgi:hypothetical protein